MAMRPLPSRNADGTGDPVFGARNPARIESGDTGSGTLPRVSDGALRVVSGVEFRARQQCRQLLECVPADEVQDRM